MILPCTLRALKTYCVWVFFCGLVLSFLLASVARGEEWNGLEISWLVAGGATGFLLHEGAHVLAAESLGVHASLEFRRTPIPFIIIRYDLFQIKDSSGQTSYIDGEGRSVSSGNQKQFIIASAGIDSQHISSELILTRYPYLYNESRPFLKGVLAFDILTSIGYALVGRKDPDGDIRGMSEALGVSDRIVGALVFLPALVDIYRYYYPGTAWTPWVSRGAKGYLLGLAFRW